MEGASPAADRTPEKARIWLMDLEKGKVYQAQKDGIYSLAVDETRLRMPLPKALKFSPAWLTRDVCSRQRGCAIRMGIGNLAPQ